MIAALIEQLSRSKDPGLLQSLVPQFQARTHAKGASLLAQGDRWTQAFFVQRGMIRIHVTDADGKDFNKSFWTEGEAVLPMTRMMHDGPSLFNISALEPAVVWQAPVSVVQATLEAKGLWQPLCLEMLARLLDQKTVREHDLLTLDGKARYQAFRARHPALAERVPVAHLASYLGLTDVSLSRIRRQLATPRF